MAEDLTLEKLRIVQKLGDLSVGMSEINGTLKLMESERKNDRKKLDELGGTVWGNGKTGLDKEVDRLKQKEKIHARIIGPLVLALIGIVARLVYDALKIIP